MPINPFSITVSVLEDLTLRAVLTNVSGGPQYYLANSWRQSPVLHVLTAGADLVGYDARSKMRPAPDDWTVGEENYALIAAGQTEVLGSGKFIKKSGGYGLSWNSQRFAGLPAGKCQAYVGEDFQNFLDVSGAAGRTFMAAAWRGSMASAKITFLLP